MEYGKITGRCGFVDPATRTIVLNPDASDEELEAELCDDLVILLEATDRRGDPPATRPALSLVQGGGDPGEVTTHAQTAT